MKEFSKRRTDAVKGLRRYRFLFPPKNKYCLVGLNVNFQRFSTPYPEVA